MSHQVVLMSRAGCSACVTAAADISRICTELTVAWTTIDVDTDPDLQSEYGDRVPVILIDGTEHGYWVVEEDRFRAALQR